MLDGSHEASFLSLTSRAPALMAEIQYLAGAPSLAQNKASTHAYWQAGFKVILAFPTPADLLSVPGTHPPPSSETFPQDKARPSAQLAFPPSITFLPTTAGDGWWLPLLPPYSLFSCSITSLLMHSVNATQVCSILTEERTKCLSELLMLSVTNEQHDWSYYLQVLLWKASPDKA